VLRLLAGTLRPEAGTVRVGEAVWLDTARGLCLAPEARRCGYVYQSYALFPHLSAWRNVAYGLRRVPRRGRRERALALLERFGLGARADARPDTLSGGEQQRVALARALACEPALLLLDEPLSALDARSRGAAARVLAELMGTLEVPAVLVTHDFAEAAQLAHEVGVMDAGRIVQRGTASELAGAPASAFVADFAGAVVLTGSARPEAGLTVVELDGGGTVTSTDAAAGRVAVSVFPWEITVSAAPLTGHDSVQNHLPARITSVTALGNRVRVGLLAGQPIVAEVTGKAAADLGLQVGQAVTAGFKATATRLITL
jgi:molybdate transport system ATP-binding protein